MIYTLTLRPSSSATGYPRGPRFNIRPFPENLLIRVLHVRSFFFL